MSISPKQRIIKGIKIAAVIVAAYILISSILAGVFFIINPPQTTPPTPVEQAPKPITVEELWRLTNAERAKADASELALNPQLNQSAQAKCHDMVEKNYWSHNAPDGTEPWVFIQDQGLLYDRAGENLASSFTDTHTVVHAWLVSPAHRDNMLDVEYDQVGFGICKSSSQTFVVQHLIAL